MSRKIGIIGSGIVAETLAKGFIKHGYPVTIGTNTPDKRDGLRARTNGQAIVGTFEDAARFGEIVVLATKAALPRPRSNWRAPHILPARR